MAPPPTAAVRTPKPWRPVCMCVGTAAAICMAMPLCPCPTVSGETPPRPLRQLLAVAADASSSKPSGRLRRCQGGCRQQQHEGERDKASAALPATAAAGPRRHLCSEALLPWMIGERHETTQGSSSSVLEK